MGMHTEILTLTLTQGKKLKSNLAFWVSMLIANLWLISNKPYALVAAIVWLIAAIGWAFHQ